MLWGVKLNDAALNEMKNTAFTDTKVGRTFTGRAYITTDAKKRFITIASKNPAISKKKKCLFLVSDYSILNTWQSVKSVDLIAIYENIH